MTQQPGTTPPPNLLMAVSHQKQFSLSWLIDYVPDEEVLHLPSAKIYKLFVNSDHWLGHHESRILEKLERFDVELPQAQNLLTNFEKLPRLPDFVRIRFIQFLFNASATGRRLAWGGEGTHVGADTPCFFCKEVREGKSAEDKGLDSWEHILTDCPVVGNALDIACNDCGISSARRGMTLFLLCDQLRPAREVIFLLAFLYAVWECRLYLKVREDAPPNTLINFSLIKILRSIAKTVRVDQNPLLVPGTGPYNLAKSTENSCSSKSRLAGKNNALALTSKF